MENELKLLEFDKILNTVAEFSATDYAKKMILELKPSNNLSETETLLDETKEAFDALVKYQDIPLGGLYDIKNAILRSKIGSILSEQELLGVASMISTTMNVINFFKNLDSIKYECPNLKKYANSLVIQQVLKSNITLAIGDDGRVVDNASRDLLMVRRNLSSTQNRLRSKMNELLQTKASMLNDSVIVIRNNRMCLPVRVEYKNTFKGIIHDESASHTTFYIEPESCITFNSQIESFQALEKKEVEKVLKSLSLMVGGEADVLERNLANLTNLDIIFAKAKYAKTNDFYRPIVNDTGIIDLKRAKHPLINPEIVVPIDINIGKKFKTIIITGPNTGGKTVTLKTVGLLTLMTETGLFIPAKPDSVVSVYDSVFVDIGDEQSIEQSLSTFSSHMTKIIKIIENLTLNCLILLDELGSGTDPKEGSAISIAIIEFLKVRGATTIATTHYSDLKAYAYNSNDVSNASVEFNTDTLKPTYRLLMGIPGKSNATLIAKRLGLDERIIADSQARMALDNTDSAVLMEKLDSESLALRNKEAELQHKINEYNELAKSLQAEKDSIIKKTDVIINKAKREAEDVLAKAKENAKELLESIEDLKNGTYKEHELAEIKHKARSMDVSLEEEKIFDENLAEGDSVYIKSYNKNGIIMKVKKDKFSVSMGQFVMDFTKKELKKIAKPVHHEHKPTKLSGYNPASHAELSLDLRGKRYEELKYELDTFMDQACLGNISQVTIIHGFGTGVVRDFVQKYLKTCSVVKSYRYGGEGEGLNGATVVYLK